MRHFCDTKNKKHMKNINNLLILFHVFSSHFLFNFIQQSRRKIKAVKKSAYPYAPPLVADSTRKD